VFLLVLLLNGYYFSDTMGRASGKKKSAWVFPMRIDWTFYPLCALAGLLTCGLSLNRAFPSCNMKIIKTVAYYGISPHLQRWPNVTDSHRIPFSPPFSWKDDTEVAFMAVTITDDYIKK